MHALAPHWLQGCRLRACWFEPTFHKHAGKLCNGVQIHTEGPGYDHAAFKPWRLQALAFKAIRRLYPGYPLWRDFAYEYEHGKLAIDVINGGPLLREWVDDAARDAAGLGGAGRCRMSRLGRASGKGCYATKGWRTRKAPQARLQHEEEPSKTAPCGECV